ncbi:protein TRACHEARY ELEMENT DIFFERENTIATION-RELATED 7A-like [Portunus trituberculatus]|uniref:protein TRACHEARY ELEMENT DIFFERENTIATION-RELATED 7A-like n=1 Tax=Portunus trituberculatus TaxID=210409 RepID=UPI001E1CF273|nr:protein TRACHEARY ELEMENT DIFFERENTIATION-RELATED 7A-like [Portunus trituberculatus]
MAPEETGTPPVTDRTRPTALLATPHHTTPHLNHSLPTSPTSHTFPPTYTLPHNIDHAPGHTVTTTPSPPHLIALITVIAHLPHHGYTPSHATLPHPYTPLGRRRPSHTFQPRPPA